MIVLAKTLSELAWGRPDDEKQVRTAATPDQNQILFKHKQSELVSRLIEGQFVHHNPLAAPT